MNPWALVTDWTEDRAREMRRQAHAAERSYRSGALAEACVAYARALEMAAHLLDVEAKVFRYRATQHENRRTPTMILDQKTIEACAHAAHEANRAYCRALGDKSHAPWESAPEWQKKSARNGVEGVLLRSNGPRESHESWIAEKQASGWSYGPIKDETKKEHPCFVPYDQLPEAQRAKDTIFVNVVNAVYVALSAVPA